MLLNAFRDIHKDILSVDTNFPVATLPSYQLFLDSEARVEVAKKKAAEEEYDLWDEKESPKLSPLRHFKCAPEAEVTLPNEPSGVTPLPKAEAPR